MKTSLYVIIFFMLTGCGGAILEKKIINNYYIIAADDYERACLSYHEPTDEGSYPCIVDATVFAAGYNDKYMIIKQHPRTFFDPPNKTITNYFILPLKKGMDWKTNNGLIGPLTLEEFEQKRKELNIESIQFTTVIKDLE